MLKSKLTSEPGDDLKGAYVKSGDEWVLDKLADDHPKMAENETLIKEKRAVETERDTFQTNASNLERERDEFKGKAIPSGYRAVKKEVEEAGNAAIAAGFTAETVKAAGDKIITFETEKAQVADRANKTKAFEFAGVANAEAALKLNASGDLKIEWRTVDGKEKPFVVGEKDGAKTETLFDKKFVEETEGFKEFAPALFTERPKSFQFSSEKEKQEPKNKFDAIAQEVKDRQKIAPAAVGTLADRFYNRQVSAAE